MELKHLAAYLPYGVKVTKADWGKILKMDCDGTTLNCVGIDFVLHTNAKLALRPLSDLTKEIEENGEKFVPTEWLQNRYELLNLHEQAEQLSKDHRWLNQSDYMLVMHLIEWKFDVFGLIEKGEAIDINTLDL